MKNYKPKYNFGHNKKITDVRIFSSSDKEWKYFPVRTQDNDTGKPKFYATAAVNEHEWWWTLFAN